MDQLVMTLTIYSRPGCHLCDEMKATVDEVLEETGNTAEMREIDIAGDPQLETVYGKEIPVLLVNGKKAAKYRISKDELRRRLREERTTD